MRICGERRSRVRCASKRYDLMLAPRRQETKKPTEVGFLIDALSPKSLVARARFELATFGL
jgi:hypothetical protein